MQNDQLKKHLQEKNVTCLEDDMLFTQAAAGISLENRTKDVRIYNCLFDDSDVWPK